MDRQADGAEALWRGATDLIGNVIGSAAGGGSFTQPEQIALSGLGVALAASALAPRLDVEMRAATSVSNMAIQRVTQITDAFLFAGLMNVIALFIGIFAVGGGDGGEGAPAATPESLYLTFTAFGVFLWSYWFFLARSNVFDPAAKWKGATGLNPSSSSIGKFWVSLLWTVLIVALLYAASFGLMYVVAPSLRK